MKDAHSITSDQILECLAQAVFTVDEDLRITYLNRSAEKIIKLSREDVLGKLCSDVFHANSCDDQCPLRMSMGSGKSCLDVGGSIYNCKGQQVKVRMTTSVLRDKNDNIIGGVAILQQSGLAIGKDSSMQCAVQACEVQSIIAALRRNNNNRTAAAHDLGIHKSTFFRKIKKMGIDLPLVDGRFRSKPICSD